LYFKDFGIYARENHGKTAKYSKICTIVMLALLLGTVGACKSEISILISGWQY